MIEIYSPKQIISAKAQIQNVANTNTIVIGIVLPRTGSLIFNDHYVLELIQSISMECSKQEYSIVIFLFHSRDNKAEMYEKLLRPGFYNGLIISSVQSEDPLLPFLIEHDIKFVSIGKDTILPHTSYVDVNNKHGSIKAVNHLVAHGYKRIAHITGPMNMTAGIDRYHGYKKALAENELPFDEKLVAEGAFTDMSGYRAMQTLLPQKPEAVFVASDTMALGALRAINEVGLSVPHDIALIGFDDIKMAGMVSPALTTIRQPIIETGKLALSMLIHTLDHTEVNPQHKTLATELIIRQSCGCH